MLGKASDLPLAFPGGLDHVGSGVTGATGYVSSFARGPRCQLRSSRRIGNRFRFSKELAALCASSRRQHGQRTPLLAPRSPRSGHDPRPALLRSLSEAGRRPGAGPRRSGGHALRSRRPRVPWSPDPAGRRSLFGLSSPHLSEAESARTWCCTAEPDPAPLPDNRSRLRRISPQLAGGGYPAEVVYAYWMFQALLL